MTRTAIPSFTTGQIVTAAFANTYFRDNEAEHWNQISALNAAVNTKYIAVVSMNAVQLISSGVGTDVLWSKNDYVDPSSMHSTSVNKERLIAPVRGVYLITLFSSFEYNATGFRMASIRNQDGTTLCHMGGVTNVNDGSSLSLSIITLLNANDYVYAHLYQNSGAALGFGDISGYHPSFSMFCLKTY